MTVGGRSKVVPTPQLLKPYQVIVPCADEKGENCGWHVMETQIPQLIAHSLKGYMMPSFVKVTLGQGQFVFEKTNQIDGFAGQAGQVSQVTYEFRHEEGKRPGEFDAHTEVVGATTSGFGGGYIDLGFTKKMLTGLALTPHFITMGLVKTISPLFHFFLERGVFTSI